MNMSKSLIAALMMFCFLGGLLAGYAWRMVQVEPIFAKELALLEKENMLLRAEIREALGKMERYKAVSKRRGEKVAGRWPETGR